MNKFLSASLALVIGLALIFGCTKQENTVPLNINEVGGDPGAFVGTITLTGITAGFAPQDPNIFGLMDRKELQCQSQNCTKLILPVRFQGQLPSLGDEILATGSFLNTGRGYLFTAETVKVVKNHHLGG